MSSNRETINQEATSIYPQWLDGNLRPGVLAHDIYKPWQLTFMSLEQFHSLDKAEQLAYLAAWGILGPTTHNTCAELFALDPERLCFDIWTDRELVLPGSDGFGPGRQNIISMGAVAETSIAAATAFGWRAEVEMINRLSVIPPFKKDEQRYEPIARVQFIPDNLKPFGSDFLRIIFERKMVRGEYDSRVELSSASINCMTEFVAKNYPGLGLHVIIGNSRNPLEQITLAGIARFQQMGMARVLEDSAFSYEFGEFLLPNEETETPRKMRGREFLRDDETTKRLHLGLIGQLSEGDKLRPDELKGFAKAEGTLVGSCSALLVITASEDDMRHQFQAGQAYVDLAHYLLHSAQGTIRSGSRVLGEIRGGFRNSMHAAMSEVDIAASMLKARLGTRNRPMVIFRVGIPKIEQDDQVPHSARPYLGRETLLPSQVE